MLNNIYHCNAIDFLSKQESSFIDLTVTSPPYDDLRSYNDDSVWSWSCFLDVARLLYNKTNDGGVLVWVVSDKVINGSESGSSMKQALHFMSLGFKLHDTMIWRKSNFSNPERVRYHQAFEFMYVFVKGKLKTFNPIKDRKNICSGKIGSFGVNTVTQTDGSKKVRARKINSDFGMRHNVWDMKTSGQDQTSKKWKHPAMFTEELATSHILSWSNIGDTVFDPFIGSGTTAVSSVKTGRNWLGCEVSRPYFELAQQRIAEAIGKVSNK